MVCRKSHGPKGLKEGQTLGFEKKTGKNGTTNLYPLASQESRITLQYPALMTFCARTVHFTGWPLDEVMKAQVWPLAGFCSTLPPFSAMIRSYLAFWSCEPLELLGSTTKTLPSKTFEVAFILSKPAAGWYKVSNVAFGASRLFLGEEGPSSISSMTS